MLAALSRHSRAPLRAGLAQLVPDHARHAAMSTSAPLPARVRLDGGIARLSLPLPTAGEARAFPLAPDMTVGTLIGRVLSEDDAVTSVSVTREQRAVDDATPVSELLGAAGGFSVEVNDTAYAVSVEPTVSAAAAPSPGSAAAQRLHRTARVLRVVRDMRAVESPVMTMEEFGALARNAGFSEAELPALLDDLDNGAVVVRSPERPDVVFTHPADVIAMFYGDLGVASPLKEQALERIAAAQDDMDALDKELGPLRQQKALLDAQVESYLRKMSWLGAAGVTGGVAVYWWLTYEVFFWDIMEPVTFFTGSAISIIGYIWWSLTNHDYEYRDMWDYGVKTRSPKVYKRNGFDLARFSELEAQRAALVELCETLAGEHPPSS